MTSAEEIQLTAEEKMQKAVSATQNELGGIRTGRANPLLLDRIQVDYYGVPTPLPQTSNISVQGGQTLVIQPYDKSMLSEIEKAIGKSELNLPANNDGSVIRINVPPLTEDRRKEMAKTVKKLGEDGKIAIRNIRRDASNDLDKFQKEANMSEDEYKGWQDDIQALTDKYTAEVTRIVSEKEKEVLEI